MPFSDRLKLAWELKQTVFGESSTHWLLYTHTKVPASTFGASCDIVMTVKCLNSNRCSFMLRRVLFLNPVIWNPETVYTWCIENLTDSDLTLDNIFTRSTGSADDYVLPRTRTRFGERGFCLSVLGFCPYPVFLFIWAMLTALKRSFVR